MRCPERIPQVGAKVVAPDPLIPDNALLIVGQKPDVYRIRWHVFVEDDDGWNPCCATGCTPPRMPPAVA